MKRARNTAALAIAVVLAGPATVPASAARPMDRIMFASNRGGTSDLYTVNADGTDARSVLGGPLDEYEADVSANGRRVVFVRSVGIACCGPTADIYIADADGSDIEELTPADPQVDDYRPQWSPDGERIAFSRGTGGGSPSNVFTVRPDGTGLEQLTTETGSGNNFATWSPDGSRLAFVSTREGKSRIWVMDSDGANPHSITDPPSGGDISPQWSPLGDQIVFRSSRDADDGDAYEVYTVRPDGTGLTRITTNSVAEVAPTWSPDGRRIAFSSLGDVPCPAGPVCPGQLWSMNADGSDLRRVTDRPFNDTFPDYLPRSGRGRRGG